MKSVDDKIREAQILTEIIRFKRKNYIFRKRSTGTWVCHLPHGDEIRIRMIMSGGKWKWNAWRMTSMLEHLPLVSSRGFKTMEAAGKAALRDLS